MENHEHKHHIRIHIDQKSHESANPTTGAALYALGEVAPGLELFREVTGDREDSAIPNTPETVHLREDEHFHSGPPQVKTFTIIVNGRKKEVTTRDLSFEQIVAIAFAGNPPSGPNVVITVTYSKGEHGENGTLLAGDVVKIKNGMIFNVSATDRS